MATPLPASLFDDSPFDVEGYFDTVPAPATEMDSLHTCDLLGSLDFSTNSTIVYVSEAGSADEPGGAPDGSVRAMEIEFLERGELTALGNHCRRHGTVVFCLDHEMISDPSPVIDFVENAVHITFLARISARIRSVYVFPVEIGDNVSVWVLTPTFETNMLRFAHEKRVYTSRLGIVDDATRSLSISRGVYDSITIPWGLESLDSETAVTMLREVVDACQNLDLEEVVCAKMVVTVLRGIRLKMLLKDAMLARNGGETVLRSWVKSLYNMAAGLPGLG